MPKISRNVSEMISLVFVSGLIALLAAAMATLPLLYTYSPFFTILHAYFGDRDVGALQGETAFWIFCYAVMVIALACAITILLLLLRVRKGLVFTSRSVAYIRYVSWGCMLIGLICIATTYYFAMSAILALAMLFLGLCLRVVKNVIEQAVAIKAENDYTV